MKYSPLKIFSKSSALVLITSALFFMFGQAFARDQISAVGSSTVYPFTTVAAEYFAKRTDFKAPVIESTGTGGGMKIFCAGVGTHTPDVTGASRAIKSSEKELCASNGVTPLENLIGYDGIVFANSNSGPEGNFTKEDIFNAVSLNVLIDGKWVPNPYKKWSDINPSFPDNEIDIMIPPPTSGTRDAFVELVMHSVCKKVYGMPKKGNDGYKALCSAVRTDNYVVQMGENDNLIIAKLEDDEKRWGVFGFSFLDQNNDKVKGATIDGVVPTFDTIADSSYKVSRPLFFYYKKEHLEVVAGLQEFVDFFNSDIIIGPEGAATDRGLIPLN